MNISFQNEVADSKHQRQANTSPILNRPRIHEYKNVPSKGAIKRNLFGEPNGDQSPASLAKQLTESPLRVKSNTLLKEPTNQTIKRSDIGSNKTSLGGREKKGITLKFIV